MKEKDLNQIAKIEKAIREKYGKETIQNPKNNWTKEKEQKYLEDLRNFYKSSAKEKNTKRPIQIEEDTFIKDNKSTEKQKQICDNCLSYSVSHMDDTYMTRYECCFRCYVQYIEGI